jgi:hypothetical protein
MPENFDADGRSAQEQAWVTALEPSDFTEGEAAAIQALIGSSPAPNERLRAAMRGQREERR